MSCHGQQHCFRLVNAATSILLQLQEPTNAAQATTQLTLLAEVASTLTLSIAAAVSQALLNVAQPQQSAAAATACSVLRIPLHFQVQG